eukprot:7378056-Prymnesium_polylepis.1
MRNRDKVLVAWVGSDVVWYSLGGVDGRALWVGVCAGRSAAPHSAASAIANSRKWENTRVGEYAAERRFVLPFSGHNTA